MDSRYAQIGSSGNGAGDMVVDDLSVRSAEGDELRLTTRSVNATSRGRAVRLTIPGRVRRLTFALEDLKRMVADLERGHVDPDDEIGV